jgi:LysM repeat protein
MIIRKRLFLMILIVALLLPFATVPYLAEAQGTAACPILILMQDTLYLRSGPSWGGTVTNTLVAGNTVCLTARTQDTAWLQVSQTAPQSGILGWAPTNAFWANVPFTVLPVAGSTVPPTTIPPTVVPVTPIPVTPLPGSQTYVVQAGDTVYSVSQRFGITIPALMQANNIPATYVIYVGQRLIIPTGTTIPTTPAPSTYVNYTVQQGEYLVLIATRYNLNWLTLANFNNIGSPYVVYPGQVLRIPSAG